MEGIPIQEMMSLAEIKARFESEWVLLETPETTKALEVKSGKVLSTGSRTFDPWCCHSFAAPSLRLRATAQDRL
jgi:hypothetical protein